MLPAWKRPAGSTPFNGSIFTSSGATPRRLAAQRFVEAQFFKDDTLAAWETAITEELATDREGYFDDHDDRRDEEREWAGMEEAAAHRAATGVAA